MMHTLASTQQRQAKAARMHADIKCWRHQAPCLFGPSACTWTGIVGQVQRSSKAVQAVAHRQVDGLPKDPVPLVCVGYDLHSHQHPGEPIGVCKAATCSQSLVSGQVLQQSQGTCVLPPLT